MAQAGYTPILIYASGTATNIPTAGNLISGSSGAELAINYADGKLYYKDGSGNVKLLSIGYGSSSVTPTNGGVQYGTGTALALTAAGSSGQILRSNGAAAPTWADLSTLGVNTISFGTTGLTPNSATAGAVTVAGTLVTANGGTGLGGATPFTANGVLYASSASALTSGSALTFDGTTFTYGAGGSATTNTAFTLNGTDNAAYGAGVLGKRNGTNTWFIGDTAWALGSGTGVINYNYGTAPWIWYLQTGGEQMRLTSTGLGIGTSSPGSRLHIYQTGSTQAGLIETNQTASVLNFKNTSQPSGQPQIGAAGSDLILNTNGSERARIDSSGNLGLGVTPSAWVLAGYKAFEVGAAGNAIYSGPNDILLTSNAYYNSGWKYAATGFKASLYEQNDGVHIWQTAPSGTAGNAITFTQAMTLNASGNLGIGETNPVNLLSLKYAATDFGASILVNNTSAVSGSTSSVRFINASSSTGFVIGKHASGFTESNLAFINQEANAPLAFFTNNTERARITSGGYFLFSGLTTSAGNYWIQAKNTDSSSNCAYLENASGNDRGILLLKHDQAAGATTGAMVVFQNSAGTTVGTITSSNTATAYNTSSDYRLKDNPQPLTGSGAFIDALKPKIWNWKADGSRGVGFIAHEVQGVSPGSVVGEKDGEQMQAMEYGSAEFIANIIAELQSLRQRVALLEGN